MKKIINLNVVVPEYMNTNTFLNFINIVLERSSVQYHFIDGELEDIVKAKECELKPISNSTGEIFLEVSKREKK